jgi:hypothetical protein
MAIPPKRAESQTPAEYMRELREWAREHTLCTNCIKRKPRVVRGKDKNGKPKKRPETCDHCLKQKAEARKRREAGTVYAYKDQTGKSMREIAKERTEQARREGKCITCRTNSVTEIDPKTGVMELNPKTGKPYATCSHCRASSAARKDAA